MRSSEVFAELLRIRRSSLVFSELLCIRRIGGVSPPLLRRFLPHLGHAFGAFGSCVWRIWVMRLPHLGHASAAFGVQEGIRGSVLKIRTLPRIRRGSSDCQDLAKCVP